ncbi:MAG: hypothetical protein U0528_20565 [Anaerolineae bacterium]
MLKDVLRVLWRGIMQFEHHGWVYVIANLFAVLISIPLITLPLAFAGLSYMSYQAQTSPAAHVDEFWAGVRKYWRHALLVGLVDVVFFAVLAVNFAYFLDRAGVLIVALRIFWLIALLLWACVQFYLWPLLEEMDQPSLRDGVRNALVMILRNPGFSLLFSAIMVLFFLISIALFAVMMLVTLSLIACLSTTAVRDRLSSYRATQKQH